MPVFVQGLAVLPASSRSAKWYYLRLQGSIDDATATKAMGMGSWRLKGAMDPPFEALTAQIEGLWRNMLEDLRLYQLDRVWRSQLRLLTVPSTCLYQSSGPAVDCSELLASRKFAATITQRRHE